jgi:hypothetical protein
MQSNLPLMNTYTGYGLMQLSGSHRARLTAIFNAVENWRDNGGIAVLNVKADSHYPKVGHYNLCYKVTGNKVCIKEHN